LTLGEVRGVDYSLRGHWAGLLTGVSRPTARVTMVAVVGVTRQDTATNPFLGLGSDGQRYWVKYLGNPDGPDSLVSERVVEALSRKLNAPMRPSILVDVPVELTKDSRLAVREVQPGVGHGSLLLEPSIEKEVLDDVKRDGNNERQPRFIALWELCAGKDGQWLYDGSNDSQVWSFDHGWWINGGEAAPMTVSALDATVNHWEAWDGPVGGMSPDSFLKVADDLDALTVSDFIDVVSSVPVEWGIQDDYLEALAWWLHTRKSQTARRMRALANTSSNAKKTSNRQGGNRP